MIIEKYFRRFWYLKPPEAEVLVTILVVCEWGSMIPEVSYIGNSATYIMKRGSWPSIIEYELTHRLREFGTKFSASEILAAQALYIYWLSFFSFFSHKVSIHTQLEKQISMVKFKKIPIEEISFIFCISFYPFCSICLICSWDLSACS